MERAYIKLLLVAAYARRRFLHRLSADTWRKVIIRTRGAARRILFTSAPTEKDGSSDVISTPTIRHSLTDARGSGMSTVDKNPLVKHVHFFCFR